MAIPQLSLVGQASETAGQRIKRLQEEARVAAQEQMATLQHQLDELLVVAREVLDGGDAFPVGVRELCRQMLEEEGARRQTLSIILNRAQAGH